MERSLEKIKVSIVGAGGYAGGELLRLFLGMPKVEIGELVVQAEQVGWRADLIHPNLRGRTNLRFSKIDDLKPCDILFLAMPHGQSMAMLPRLKLLASTIIDLAADFRLKSPEDYRVFYGIEHPLPELLSESVYGLAELHREDLRKADYIACGGCEATAGILALYPLFKNDLIKNREAILDVKIGSSAGGSKPSAATHHPIRSGCLRSYKLTGHRHSAEIKQEVQAEKIHLSATAVDMVRGILATGQVFLKEKMSEERILEIYRETYRDELFIRIISDKRGLYRFPEPKIVAGTNFCDIGFEVDPFSDRLVVVAAIDNLVKGTAGQAIQAMNIRLGWPETYGLEFLGLHPV